MLTRNNASVFLAAWIDACAYWRLYMPHLNLPGSSFFCFAERPDFNVIAGNDVCIVQRCCTPQQMEFLRTAQILGMRIVYDLDDNVWELPEYNPAASILGQFREGFISCIRMTDVVSVSTKALAKAVRKHVRVLVNNRGKEIPIMVAGNRIDTRLFAPVAARDGGLVVGWAGSTSHRGDFSVAEAALLSVASDNRDVVFEFRGCPPPPELAALPNFRFKPWMPVAEFGARMPNWGWDIALAPVVDNDFNRAKSCIKMIEAAYCSIPCLASWVTPYEEFCSHDSELRWLLCASNSSWQRKLNDLIHDSALRSAMGARMYNVAVTHYSWQQVNAAAEWHAILDAARG